jgi:low affinity Fe/Cu permease
VAWDCYHRRLDHDAVHSAAEHRDTQSMQAKLDELLHAHKLASNAMTRIDDEEPEDIERHRKDARKND